MRTKSASNRERPQRQQHCQQRDDLRYARVRAALAAAGYDIGARQIDGVTCTRVITRL